MGLMDEAVFLTKICLMSQELCFYKVTFVSPVLLKSLVTIQLLNKSPICIEFE